MGRILLLDTTLRDGGYINDWNFGKSTISGYLEKISRTGIEICEVGFIKNNAIFNSDRTYYPNVQSITNVIRPKADNMMYVGMVDMSSPVPFEAIPKYEDSSIDGIRVIFKKSKIGEGYRYCEYIKSQGYKLFVNLVGTDCYSDEEFIDVIEKFNVLKPFALSIVDSFGMIEKNQFLRLCYIADNNLATETCLAYHAHNNMQQAMGNAQALVSLNLKRDVIVDGSVFGMGRGAGNLNLELFARYMNQDYGTSYRLEPMLEIIDEYLMDIYKRKYWGYSLPLYLSAINGCHPNYAIYLQEKNTLTEKDFNELLKSIPQEKKALFSKENAESVYKRYMDILVDDKRDAKMLQNDIGTRSVLILAPGKSLMDNENKINEFIHIENPLVFAVNFYSNDFPIDFVFSSNMRRYSKIQNKTNVKCIVTSNVKEASNYTYRFNFSSYCSKYSEIIDNSGLMLLKIFLSLGVKAVNIVGMDGYDESKTKNYFSQNLEFDFSKQIKKRNDLIATEIFNINKNMKINFLTRSVYEGLI